jgi:hypothetical protein
MLHLTEIAEHLTARLERARGKDRAISGIVETIARLELAQLFLVRALEYGGEGHTNGETGN